MAVVESSIATRTDGIDAIVSARRRFPVLEAAVGAVGLVLLLGAMFVMGSMATVPRSFLAVVGGVALWYGLQKLGAYKFGPEFSLGLILSAVFVAMVVLGTIFADLLPIDNYKKTVTADRLARPQLSFSEPLGRDVNGGSLTSQVIYAGRVSLTIVLLAVVVGVLLGSLLGLLAGYFGGWIETVINVVVNTSLAFPPLILLIVIISVYDPTVWSIGIGLAVVSVPTYARLMRAQSIALREREYVMAARAMGSTSRRIMFREILPNAALPVLSYMFINAAIVIIAEGSLAYLGLGVPFPKPTWGALVSRGQDRLKNDPHLVFVPATVMFLVALSLNRIGDWSRKRVLGERNILG